ncbi:hypothetical protein V5O48_005699 [Marasmius crinis-equi]|uniref:Uncharacterized protein n=1 Tax=Marasmius crinis-equi TaxID=585013 RepID=A0ABR3FLJ8_9AGAR
MVPGVENSPLPTSSSSNLVNPSSTQRRNTQLPSPVSPTTHPSPPNASPAPSAQCNESLEALLNPRNNVPVRGFVHEVLRRSRTSGTVLQTALCYLEAIRAKLPELIRQEKAGEGVKGELELDSRITPATEAELELEALMSASSSCSSGMPTLIVNDSGDAMDTVKVFDCDSEVDSSAPCAGASAYGLDGGVPQAPAGDDTLKKSKSASPPLAPLPPLPSPLLCPRRAFLASLILASKFTQDKCYSNRAWAKLSGLPPREIGRCERALGDMLEWRLWVGKSPASSSPSPASTPASQTIVPGAAVGSTKTVTRCQSESNLRSSASERSAFLATDKPTDGQKASPVLAKNSPLLTRPLVRRSGSGLRRASTLPAEAFSSPIASSSSARQYLSSRARNNNAVAQWIINSHGQSHAEQIDQEMYSPEMDGFRSEYETPSTTNGNGTANHVTCSLSPYPPTPGLSYSPSSSTTESSLESGDRTIQMSAFSSFEDGSMTGSFGSVGSLNALLGGCGSSALSSSGLGGTVPWTNASSPAGNCAPNLNSNVGCKFAVPGTNVPPFINIEHPLDGYHGWSMGSAVGTMVV